MRAEDSMLSSAVVKARPSPAYLPLVLLLLTVLGAAQGQRAPAAPAERGAPTVAFEGRELPVPVIITPAGPMFALEPLAQALGGRLAPGESGESFTLALADRNVVIGIGSSIVTVGDEIVSLSQPLTRGEAGVQVPLDFLGQTYGDLLGYAFDWRPEQQRLDVSRRSAREIPVALDVVHLEGTTTVVLQFPTQPRYQLDERPGRVEVQMLADRLAVPSPPRRVEDPLVRAVHITPGAVRLDLAPGTEVESYVLGEPFRLVFDVHRRAAAAEPAVPQVAPRPLPPGIRTIVLDPGHGGRETGAVGPSGTLEKELTLQLAASLAARLQQRMPVRVVLTRAEDAALPLDTRTAIANQNKADLFVSVHLNSSLGTGAHGAETYFLSDQATDTGAAKAAQAENAAEAPAGSEPGAGADPAMESLSMILWDLAQSRHLAESQRLANLIQGELNQTLQLKDRGVKQAPFRVLMGAAMPAVLVELGFISNPEEETKLLDPAYRADLVEALVRAIARYKDAVEGRPEMAQPVAPPAAANGPGAGAARPPAGTEPPAAARPPAPGAASPP